MCCSASGVVHEISSGEQPHPPRTTDVVDGDAAPAAPGNTVLDCLDNPQPRCRVERYSSPGIDGEETRLAPPSVTSVQVASAVHLTVFGPTTAPAL